MPSRKALISEKKGGDVYKRQALNGVINAAVDHIVYGGSALLAQEHIYAGS